jgi:uncharacterized protein
VNGHRSKLRPDTRTPSALQRVRLCDVRREIMWTDESEDHIWKQHGVRPAEVEDVVYCRPRYVTPGRGGIEEVYGQTSAGRYLLVILSEALDGRDYVVTARDMEPEERRLYQRKAR